MTPTRFHTRPSIILLFPIVAYFVCKETIDSITPNLYVNKHSYPRLLLVVALLSPKSSNSIRVRANHHRSFPRNGLFLSELSDDRWEGGSNFLGQESKSIRNASNPVQRRTISRIDKFARLPIWPLWNGIFIYLVSKLPFMSDEMIAKLESTIGGRVCPNFFSTADTTTSPFIMLVHHIHSFHPWDPLRYIQKLFFPEGFPAHPHRGFCTITYCLHGGMVHRDSLGVRQVYGASQNFTTQLLVAGRGLLHEEMWDTQHSSDLDHDLISGSKQELFQLWLNLPSKYKMISPSIQLLKEQNDSMPTVVVYDNPDSDAKAHARRKVSSTMVLAGKYQNDQSVMTLYSDVTILHVKLYATSNGGTSNNDPSESAGIHGWSYILPESYQTAILYVRSGSIIIEGKRVASHHTANLSPMGRELFVYSDEPQTKSSLFDFLNTAHEPSDNAFIADFLLLTGEPLQEPVIAQGSMVMNSYQEITQAYLDYQMGKMGVAWKETLSDKEWRDHVNKFRPWD